MTIQQPSRTQVQIAQRMSESRATIPDFTLRAEVDMERRWSSATSCAGRPSDGEVVPSYNDMVVKACGIALREHPRANAAYRDGAIRAV